MKAIKEITRERHMKAIKEIIRKNIAYTQDGRILHFISDEDSRPDWSKALNRYYTENNIDPQMKQQYASQRSIMNKDDVHRRFTEFVSKTRGVKVDLASGPSGYFAPFLDTLAEDDLFIATDACPAIVKAHAGAYDGNNFYIFDVDLDKELPFKDESVDLFTGNYLNNVNNYASLLLEACRCLKKGGRLAVIELFFEQGCKTYEQLCSEGAIWSSFETFTAYCESIGFTLTGSDIIHTRKGKISEGDLYPLDDNDRSTDRTVYFEKK